MMNISKIEKITVPQKEEFTMQEGTVQAATIGKCGKFLYVNSPKRYKLFTDGTDTVLFLSGNGFFKWKRGETKFACGDCFAVSETGEYEINGASEFIVLKA